MTDMVTFSTVTLRSYRISDWTSIGAYANQITIACRTGTFSDITSLQALQGHIGTQRMMNGKTKIQTLGGTKATLTINGTAYTNCYISSLTWREVQKTAPLSRWEYTVKFVQETV